MRMLRVNILNSLMLLRLCQSSNVKKYFSVSTDKAANSANLMGASKRLMELFMMNESDSQVISLARFANVAFSDGSLLYGFERRFMKKQPISAPRDIERYFMSPKEAGELCLLSCLLGSNREIFFPVEKESLKLVKFSEVAAKYVEMQGFKPYRCGSEEEARRSAADLIKKGFWPCYFFDSDTSGEKPYEEFYSERDNINFCKFKNIGIVENEIYNEENLLKQFQQKLNNLIASKSWGKSDLIKLLTDIVSDFYHVEKNKNLDERM